VAGLANFDLDTAGERGGDSESRAEDLENQRVAIADEFHPPADADTQGFEAEGFFIVGINAPDDRADAGREFIEPDQAGGWIGSCHSMAKYMFRLISQPGGGRRLTPIEAEPLAPLFVRGKSNADEAVPLSLACGKLSLNCCREEG
jgi:hypothetical protein